MKEVTDTTLHAETSVLNLVIKFYTPNCNPCRILDPVLEELTRESNLSGISWIKVDGAANPESATAYGVTSVPTLILLEAGKVKAKHVGLSSKDYLLKVLKEAFPCEGCSSRDTSVFQFARDES